MDLEENRVKVKKEFRVFCPYYEEWMDFKRDLDKKFNQWGTIEGLKAQFLLGCLDRSTYTFLQRKCRAVSFIGMGYDDLCDVLEEQYSNDIPVTFVHIERKKFYATSRRSCESPKEWLQRLQELSVTCKFGPSSKTIMLDKFISDLNSRAFSRISQRDEKLSLEEALAFAERFEMKEVQVAKPNLVNERHLPYIPPFLQFYFERNMRQTNHMSTGIKWDKRIKNDDELEKDWLNSGKGVLKMCRVCGKKGKQQTKYSFKSHICFECQPDAYCCEVGTRNKRTYNIESIQSLDEIDSIKQITDEEYTEQLQRKPKYVSKYKQIVDSVPFVSRSVKKVDELREETVINELKSDIKSKDASKSEVKTTNTTTNSAKTEVKVKDVGNSGTKSNLIPKTEIKSSEAPKDEVKSKDASTSEVKQTDASKIDVKPTDALKIEVKPTDNPKIEVKPTDIIKCEVNSDPETAKADQNWQPNPIIEETDSKTNIKAEEKQEIKEKIQSTAVPPPTDE